MIQISDLTDDQLALLQDPGRLTISRQFFGASMMPDPDFDTLIDLIRSQSGVQKAFIALVDGDTVSYQSFAKREDCSLNLSEIRDTLAVTCLIEQQGTEYQTKPKTSDTIAVWGAPIMVAGHAIGSLCLVDTGASDGPNPDQLEKSALLVASLYELKKSARARVMEKFDLSRANIRYALALKAGRVATWSWSKDDGVVECDTRMRELVGLPDVGAIKTKQFLSQIEPHDLNRLKDELSAFDGTQEDMIAEFRAKRSGNYILALGHLFERDEDGQPMKVLGVAIDLTESKRSEAKTRLLLREVNHRVKNMLAILQSLASQTLRNSQSPEHFTRAFSGRLAALATSHSLLSDHEWDDIDLVSLIKTQVKPYASHFAEQVSIEGEPIAINADTAIALGMVMHELATNAMQHGALCGRDGRIAIRLSSEILPSEQKVVTIDWIESGGPSIDEKRRRGFGSVLIDHSLNKVVGSDVAIAYQADGLVAKITVPL